MLLAIADFADDEGRAYPAISTLAEKCRTKPRYANVLIAALKASGELVVVINGGPQSERSGQRTNLYRIVLSRLPARARRGHPDIEDLNSDALHSDAPLNRDAALHSGAARPAPEFPKPLHQGSDKPSLNHQEPSDTSLARPDARFPDCPQQEIRNLYAELLPTLPSIKKWGPDRERLLRARWRETAEEKRWTSTGEGLAWFRRFFQAVNDNDWAMGRSGRGTGHETWECSIDYLLSVKGFRKIIESAGRGKAAA